MLEPLIGAGTAPPETAPTAGPPDALPTEPPAAPGRPGFGLLLLGVALALVGGVLGVGGAIVREVQTGGFFPGAFVAAPLIEEAMKPAGIYILLLRWPQALLGRWHTALLTALSGLCFGAIESAVYVMLYFPHHSHQFVVYRFTVPLLMHGVASSIVGFGLSRGIIDWAAGRGPLPKVTRNCYIAAAALHATFNITVVTLSLMHVLSFKP